MRIGKLKTTLKLSLITICLSPISALAAPVAILTDVRGAVQVVHGGKSATAANGKQLQEGDMVRVAKGSATVYYVTKPPQPLRAGQQVRVTNSHTSSAPSLWNNVYSGIASGFERRKVKTAATVRNPGIQSLSPVNSRIMERPIFMWAKPKTEATALTFTLTITDANGAKVWQTTTQQPFLLFLSIGPALETGKRYIWMIETTDDKTQRKLQSRNAWFEIAAPAEVEAVRGEMTKLNAEAKALPGHTRKVITASALIQKRFYADAIRALIPDFYAPSQLSQSREIEKLMSSLSSLDASSRVLLRDCYVNTRQHDLAQKIDALKPGL